MSDLARFVHHSVTFSQKAGLSPYNKIGFGQTKIKTLKEISFTCHEVFKASLERH